MKKTIFLSLFLLLSTAMLWSQTDKLSWKVSGRMHFDGVGYLSGPDTLSAALDLVDVRMGVKVAIDNWKLKIDVSYSNDKVSLKDAFLEYARNHQYFRVGHQYVTTGIEGPNSSNNMLFNQVPNSADFFSFNRRLGFSYTRSIPAYYLSAGVFVGDDIHVRSTVKQGCSTALRGVWRPIHSQYQLLHVGASAYYGVPNHLKGTDYKNITFENRGVVRSKGPHLHSLPINHARNRVNLTAEFYGVLHKWMLQGECYWTRVNRQEPRAYEAYGGYLQAGYLICGRNYGYDAVDAFPTLPSDKGALLLVARYNDSRMNDSSSALYAGNQQDFSLGLDYFYNSYLSARLGYSFVKLDEYATIGKDNLHVIQARLQFKF